VRLAERVQVARLHGCKPGQAAEVDYTTRQPPNALDDAAPL
jgi:hypothetical protein